MKKREKEQEEKKIAMYFAVYYDVLFYINRKIDKNTK